MKWKKIIFSLVFFSFMFSVFHDFVFNTVDPCMQSAYEIKNFFDGNSNDPLCEIHQEFHIPFTYVKQFKIPVCYFSLEKKDYYEPPLVKELLFDIFKPPTLA